MSNYIAIDGGTTNTRINLVSGGKVIDTLKFNTGARQGIGGNELLRETVKNGISEILAKNGLEVKDITRILAAGMITSEYGLCNIPHATVPVGISELHTAMHEVTLNDICDIPFVFMRGVKTDCGDVESADMMRGEETEIFGFPDITEAVYVLPGSHSKIIQINGDGKIVNFKTMMTGEMLASLSQYTILKGSVDIKTAEILQDYLLKGYEYCDKNGINEALFKVRILKNLFNKSNDEAYSFLMGVILCNEVKYILALKPSRVIIGGNKAFKEPTAMLLNVLSNAQVTALSDQEVQNSTSLGMVKIYEYE